jgi:hypothetical protein
MAKPGVMIYFGIAPALNLLSDSEKGCLLDAILAYGASGTTPEFEGMLAMAWEFMKLKIDRDDTAYNNSIAQKQYANFCKKRTALNLLKVPFEDWQSASEEPTPLSLCVQSKRKKSLWSSIIFHGGSLLPGEGVGSKPIHRPHHAHSHRTDYSAATYEVSL